MTEVQSVFLPALVPEHSNIYSANEERVFVNFYVSDPFLASGQS